MTDLVYRGDVYSTSGYARAVRNNIRAMIEAGMDLRLEPVRHDNITVALDEFWKQHMPKLLEPPTHKPMIRLTHQTPDLWRFNKWFYEIGFTVFETSKVPSWDLGGIETKNWVRQMNKCEEIWTASQFCADVFEKSGVDKPVFVFPHPIDLNLYSPGPKQAMQAGGKRIDREGMTFLSVFQWNKRKDPTSLLTAWWAEMGNVPDAHLVLKTYGQDFAQKQQIIDTIRKLKEQCHVHENCGNVYLMITQIDDERMPELYRSSDVLVTTSLGEGFGLPMQEAMACGKPVIYPDASALSELCEGWGCTAHPEPAHGVGSPWYSIDMDWWKVDMSSIRNNFRQSYNEWKNQPEKFKRRGDSARRKIMSHAYDKIGKAMCDRIKEIQEKLAVLL